MAIQFITPTLKLPPIKNCVDALIASAQLTAANFASPVPALVNAFHQHSIFLSFLPAADDRLRFKALSSTGSIHRSRHAFSLQPEYQLRKWLAASTPGFANTVLVLPPYQVSRFDTVQATITSLRTSAHAHSSLVAIATVPRTWASLRGIDGWIACDTEGEYATGESVHLSLSTFLSATRYTAIDEAAVADVFGTPDSPAVALRAMWMVEHEELHWLPAAAASRLRSATTALAFPIGSNSSFLRSKALHQAVRSSLSPAAGFSICLTAPAVRLPLTNPLAVSVVILAR